MHSSSIFPEILYLICEIDGALYYTLIRKIFQIRNVMMSVHTIKEVYGVSTYLSKEVVRIKFRRPLPIDSWHELLMSISELLENRLLNWEFDLTELENPCSTDIGMWVTCSSRIKLKLGKLDFIVKKSSHVYMLLEFTRLMEIFNVVLLK